jgi:hypothetical protein
MPTTNADAYIVGIVYQQDFSNVADAVEHQLLEVGFGEAGYEVTQIQFPNSFVADTQVGYWLKQNLWLPEPFLVPRGTVVSVRFTSSTGGQYTAQGVKLYITSNVVPIEPNEASAINNFKSVSAGNGISVSERAW